MSPILQRIFPLLLMLVSMDVLSSEATSAPLFNYQETIKSNLDLFPQWLSVLERHRAKLLAGPHCSVPGKSDCRVEDWLTFLEGIKHLSDIEKIHRVNEYANRSSYVLDKDNYDVDDYWATPQEFLNRNGDCEDYAIIKMLSLKSNLG
jgi:predicted transglutaminase-like cysteine proteinase